MSDELDLIRHLRAPAPDPSIEVIRQSKEHLMQFIDASTTPQHRRPRARIAASIALPPAGCRRRRRGCRFDPLGGDGPLRRPR